MVNFPKQYFQGQRKPPLECRYCHGKNHIEDKYFKLVGYPLDHPYHPHNKGKKRPFNNNGNGKNAAGYGTHTVGSSKASELPKANHAMQTATSGVLVNVSNN